MKRKLNFQLIYFLFWVFYFAVARAAFLLYHLDKTELISYTDISKTFLYGLRLDLSFASYLSAIPFLVSLLAIYVSKIKWGSVIKVYSIALLVIITILLTIDLELYSHWGFRLDTTPLQYLSNPDEMAASAASTPFVLLTGIGLILIIFFILLYIGVFKAIKLSVSSSKLLSTLISLAYLVLLILPLRGGWQQIPINQSVVYFSETPYINHAGLNMPWNLMHAILKHGKTNYNPYSYMDEAEAENIVKALIDTDTLNTATPKPILNQDKPNVLFIILESYTAKFIGSIGGEKGVTPNLDKAGAEGVNFTNIYASGDRSEKGMVALLSGYPVQTITSIIKTPKKTEKLPHLSKVFENNGYSTSFFYGGELEFANIKSYLLNGGYDKLIDKYDFDPSTYNSKWGTHDHILFERVLEDLNKEKAPFFSTIYTLSSHEPFEIPIDPKFPGSDDEALFRNSVNYTDWALGKFLDQAKQQAWWNNTLIVIVADHGHPLPGNDANHEPSKFKIPFIMTGGALATKGITVSALGSQTDISKTLLQTLNLPADDFVWGRNLFVASDSPHAFYVFNDGFGFITPQGTLTYDNVAKREITKDSGVMDKQIRQGKAYMQFSYTDFVKK